MNEKLKAFWKIITDRIKSPVILFALVAQLLLAAKISPENLTSWAILWDNIVLTVSNPYAVGLIFLELAAFFNNPTDKENF